MCRAVRLGDAACTGGAALGANGVGVCTHCIRPAAADDRPANVFAVFFGRLPPPRTTSPVRRRPTSNHHHHHPTVVICFSSARPPSPTIRHRHRSSHRRTTTTPLALASRRKEYFPLIDRCRLRFFFFLLEPISV